MESKQLDGRLIYNPTLKMVSDAILQLDEGMWIKVVVGHELHYFHTSNWMGSIDVTIRRGKDKKPKRERFGPGQAAGAVSLLRSYWNANQLKGDPNAS